MKGKITLAILEKLSEAAADAGDLFSAFLTAGYGASYSRLQYEAEKHRRARQNQRDREAERRRLRERYSSMIYKLKRDNLIGVDRKGKIYDITAQGRKELERLKRRAKDSLPETSYPKTEVHVFTVVSFDIPERERRKRDWLRAALRNLGLTMVHKSVWMGKVKIPRQLIDDLFKSKILDYVEIFEVTKAGSVRHIA